MRPQDADKKAETAKTAKKGLYSGFGTRRDALKFRVLRPQTPQSAPYLDPCALPTCRFSSASEAEKAVQNLDGLDIAGMRIKVPTHASELIELLLP